MSLKSPTKHAVLTCNATNVLRKLVDSMKDLEFANLTANESSAGGVNEVCVEALITRKKGRPVSQTGFARVWAGKLFEWGNVSGSIDGVQVMINDKFPEDTYGYNDYSKPQIGVRVTLVARDHKAHSEAIATGVEKADIKAAIKLLKKHGYTVTKA